MSEKRKKKKRASQQGEVQWSEESTIRRGDTVHNYYTLNNPGGVQIGTDNMMIFREAQSLLENPKDAEDRGLGKKEICIALINSILNPNCSSKSVQMQLSLLEETFMKHARGCLAIRSFKDASGMPLRNFIQLHSSRYDLYSKKGKETVRMKARSPPKQTSDSTCSVNVSDQTVPKMYDRSPDDVPSNALQEEVGSDEKGDGDDNGDCEATASEEWQEVKSRRQNPSRQQTETTPEDSFLNSDYQHVKELLRGKQSDVLIFYPDENVYTNNVIQFMKDVVSLWNTPSRHKASIVLGIVYNENRPNEVTGLQVRGENDLYQTMFDSEYFTLRPSFTYKEYVYDEKVVGEIEVLSSHGAGAPSIVKRDVGCLKANELWVRSGKINRICSPSDFFTVQIYQWFSGAGLSSDPGTIVPRPVTKVKAVKQPKSVLKDSDEFSEEVRQFQKGHFVLINGGIPGKTKLINALAQVPWVAVYDFDPFSRDIGLLSFVEGEIDQKRYLHVSTWANAPSGITESGTQWICLRGLREIPESRTDDNAKSWFQIARNSIDNICIQLARFVEDYTVLRLVVVWPDDKVNAQCIFKFICRMNEHLQDPPRIILCYETEPESTTSLSAMNLILSDNEENTVKFKASFDNLCSVIDIITKNIGVLKRAEYELPKEEGHSAPGISDKDAAWLKEDLEVLYLANPYTREASDVEVLNTEVENFFRGGTLHWFAWYDLATAHVDVERELLNKIIDHIDQKFLKEFRSGIVTLFHAPGSGGSTLAQRIVWELRKKAPCCEVKPRSTMSLDDIGAKIRFLYDNAHLPVIVLIDGEDEPRVKRLSKSLLPACVVFLYVKRYPYHIKDPTSRPKENKFWLRGEVTPEEAGILALKFSDRCGDEEKKRNLIRLCKEVQKNGRTHFMFEFGMAVYHNEFQGIEAFVKGYLRLDRNPTRGLLPWQKILGFLSLVYYYGQCSLPCKIFAPLLGKPPNYDIGLDDFPYPIKEFIIEDTVDGNRKHIRICHYFLAKEILEQLLSRSSRSWRGERLSKNAKRNLQAFCIEFISMLSRKKSRSANTAYNITAILARTFIFRDNKDVGENEPQSKTRPLFSQVILDVDSDAPYSGRLAVLKELSSSFPDDPNFLAHLGRFYAYCRPEEESMAEKCFKEALQLCKNWSSGRVFQGTDEGVKLTLMHIYHMYGMIYQRRIAKFTGRGPDETPDTKLKPNEFQHHALKILDDAETACSYFTQCRENTPTGHEECHGFSNEILVRLQVCDFVRRYYKDGDGTLKEFVTARRQSYQYPVAQFIKDSISEVEDLIMQCYSLIEPDNIDYTFQKAVLWYHLLFNRNPIDLTPLMHGEDVPSRRLLITVKKLKFDRNGHLTIFDGPIPQDDVTELVALYEENLDDALLMGDINKKHLEMDVKEWLHAVRHSSFLKVYSLNGVLKRVRFWNELVQSPTAKFYHFVLLSLIGFGDETKQGNSESLVEAQIIKEDMMKLSKAVLRPRFPREWMGKSNRGIKRLVPNSRISGHIEGRSIKGVLPTILSVSKGTIAHPNNKRLAGLIDLDLGNNSIPIKVFFIPLLADMYGARFAGQRVQFYLAFTLDHGYEAYNIQILNKYPCPICNHRLEIKLDEESGTCISGHRVEKHETVPEEQELGGSD